MWDFFNDLTIQVVKKKHQYQNDMNLPYHLGQCKKKKLLLILKTSCSNDYIKNQLQIYKKIINSNKVLKIPKTTYQNYFGLLQYLKKFIYYYKLINSNVSENESKITALQSLLLLESFIE